MEERKTDAQISRDRCLDAIITAGDFDTQRALWKAAAKYQTRVRSERRAGLHVSSPPPHARDRGLVGARETW
jgi:hypothetical protein